MNLGTYYKLWRRKLSGDKSAERLKNQVGQLNLLSIDLELTGLEAELANVVSMGWIEITQLSINYQSAHHNVIKQHSSLNQSPVIHGITDKVVSRGVALKQELLKLAQFADTHVWVFHHHRLDWLVLRRLFSEYLISVKPPIILDTLLLERYLCHKHSPHSNLPVDLASARHRHHLPVAIEHNALEDANATAELLLSQISELASNYDFELADLKHTGALIF